MKKDVAYIDASECEMGAFNKIEDIKNWIKIGDSITIASNELALEYDCDLPETLEFVVTEKYNHVLLMEKQTLKNYIHRQSISYTKLYLLLKDGLVKIKRGAK